MFTRDHAYDLTRHFKIWFSKNPDVALGVENELRLIRWREKNPNLSLSLMASSACLTPEAYEKLKIFCNKHRLQLVDLDTDVLPTLTHPNDIAIFHLARQELEHVRTKSGGNLAAASDLARMILPVLQTYGTYSDLDATLILAKPLPPTLTVQTPLMLLDSIMQRALNGSFVVELNNAVVMVPIGNTADDFLRSLQAFLIDRYRLSDNIAAECERYDFLENVMKIKGDEQPVTSIFECRRILEACIHQPDSLVEAEDEPLTEAEMDEYKHMLEEMYMKTVLEVSGPNMLRAFIHDYHRQAVLKLGGDPDSEENVLASEGEEATMIGKMHPYQLDNVMKLKTAKYKHDDFKQIGDLSWTFFGASNKQARDARLTHAAKIIQRAWRKNRE